MIAIPKAFIYTFSLRFHDFFFCFVFVFVFLQFSIKMFEWFLSFLDLILISLRRIMLKDTCKRKCLHNEVMNKIDVP